MKQIAVRSISPWQWLVCEALPHKRGLGVFGEGALTGAHTTGARFGTFNYKSQAIVVARQVAKDNAPCEIVEWIQPTDNHQNLRYIDLDDDDAWISINPDKIVESIQWRTLRCIDVTGIGFELRLQGHPVPLLSATDGKFRVADVKSAILGARKIVMAATLEELEELLYSRRSSPRSVAA